MTRKVSVAVVNAMNDAYETTIGATPVMQFRTGAPPANCAAADTGTLLASLTLPSDWLTASSSGVKSKSGTWSGTGAAAGDTGYYRIKDSGLTTCHEQGTVGYSSTAWLVSTAYILGQKVNNGGNVYNCTTVGTSASSGGGPTGTGTGITDGTAVWAYVSAVPDMAMDNINIAIAQSVVVNTFTVTQAGN